MFKIDDNQNIYITRGDTASFRPIIEDYDAAEGDVVVFAVKKAMNDAEPLIRISVAAGDNIEIAHDTTANLLSGTYLYDSKLVQVDGNISTFVNGKRFIILGDIDNGNN